MPKGIHSQGVCLLTNRSTSLDDVKQALAAHNFPIVKEVAGQETWAFSGPCVVVPFRPEVHGYVTIDVVNQRWPDAMGDPKTDALTFGAWTMSFFGPFAYPRGLARSRQHRWRWASGPIEPDLHEGFIRIRCSYTIGAKKTDKILPGEYRPLDELNFLSRLVLAVFEVASVFCYFNPNGEVLADRIGFQYVWNGCKQQQKIALPLWMNVRHFEVDARVSLSDTVGNGQLDVDDVEALYLSNEYEKSVIADYLQNVTNYLLHLKRPLRTGESIDGPGETNLSWTMELLENGACDPPRDVLRLYPKADRDDVQAALAAVRPAK